MPPTFRPFDSIARRACILAAAAWMFCVCRHDAQADGDALPDRGWSGLFAELDRDGDLKVTRDEFLNRELEEGPRPAERAAMESLQRRDFMIFDFDRDEALNKLEFALVHTIDSAATRGPIPDPFDTLADQAMAAIDESYDQWNLRPDETVPTRMFVENFLRSISDGEGGDAVSGRLLQQADPDSDQQVSRDEAFRFLQQQLGIRWGDVRLRLIDGRVVKFSDLLTADQDRDGRLTRTEFTEGWSGSGDVEQAFATNDRNGDQEVSLVEFAHSESPNLFDPIAWFRVADRDLDAALDREEMEAATVGPRRELIACSLASFDDDGDGKLSLQEYRLTLHASHNYPWTSWPLDRDGDQRLSLREFQFDRFETFHLQRRFYFHRLDVDRDGFLSSGEFVYRIPASQTMTLTSLDGTTSERLLTVNGVVGSPDVSPDGKRIVFHQIPDADVKRSQIAILDVASGEVVERCQGLGPSWSADGTEFVCGREGDSKGVWIVSVDGQAERRIADGWAPRWSPDGKQIAFLNEVGLGVIDLDSGTERTVLRRDETGYQYFWWNPCWSPDSKEMVIRGDRLRRSDALIVNMREPGEARTRVAASVEMGTFFAWSPDGNRILFPMRNPREKRSQLFQVSPHGDGEPEVVEQFDRGFEPYAGCFTPDGEGFVCVWQSSFESSLPEPSPARGGGRM